MGNKFALFELSAVRHASKLCSKGLRDQTGPAHLKQCVSAQSCPTFPVGIVKLLSVFDYFCGGAFLTASAMDVHGFVKRMKKLAGFGKRAKSTAPVHTQTDGDIGHRR